MRLSFSKIARKNRETIKKGCAKLSQKVLRSFSYPLLGIPTGLAHLDDRIEELYSPVKTQVFLPKSVSEILPCFYTEENIPADGILTVPSATATSLGGNLNESGKLITTYLQPLDGKLPHMHELFRFTSKRFFPRIFKTDETIMTLAAGWQGAFYHWMYDVLPRMHLVEKKGISGRIFIEAKAPFQKESLSLMGISEDRIINIKDFQAVQTSTLVVPSISALPTPWGCQFLRSKFLPKLDRQKKRRIYISRNDAKCRRLLNEKDVLDLLRTKGFEKIVLSELSLQQQMEVFYGAEIVVGPHGAGFSHLVFCDPKTPILEFFSPSYVNCCYWQISNRVDLSYFYLLGKKRANDVSQKDPDIEVDLEEVHQSLKLVGVV